MKKTEVLKLIVQMGEDNRSVASSILGEKIIDSAKKALEQECSMTEIKEKAKNLIYLVDQIEDHEFDYARKMEHNRMVPGTYSFDELEVHIRYIEGYKHSIKTILENV